MNTRKCALYIRVSTLRQADVEDGSLDTQEARLRAYVDYENNDPDCTWEIVGVYREEGRSGKDLNRPEFQRMRQDIDDGKINTIIIWKIDRLTRSLKDFSIFWDTLQEKGIQLISLNEKFDTTTAIGRAMISIILVFAQLEREQTGERTSVTMQYRAEQGLWNGGRVIGYDLDPDNKGVLKVNPAQAEIVKKAFDLCIEKGSAGKAQRALNELGYKMPVYESRRGKKHGGSMFNKQAIIKMLSNPVYVGNIVWAGKEYESRHEPIIDKKTFDKVQKLMEKNRKTRTNEKIPKEHVYILQGILKCGKCGSMMTPKSITNGKSKPYFYYQCTRNTQQGDQGCDMKYLPADTIEDFIVERVKELTTSNEEIENIIFKANKRGNEKIRKLTSEKTSLEKNLQDNKDKLDKLIASIESGTVKSFDVLNERMESLENENKAIEKRIKDIDFEISKIEQDRLSKEVMIQNFRSFRDIIDKAKPNKLKELLFRIVEVVEWNEDEKDESAGHCRISYFEEPNLILPKNKLSQQSGEHLLAESMNWLPGTDSNCRQGG